MKTDLLDKAKTFIGAGVGILAVLVFIAAGVTGGMHVIENIELSLQKKRVEACHELAEQLTDGELSQCIDDALKPRRRRNKE